MILPLQVVEFEGRELVATRSHCLLPYTWKSYLVKRKWSQAHMRWSWKKSQQCQASDFGVWPPPYPQIYSQSWSSLFGSLTFSFNTWSQGLKRWDRETGWHFDVEYKDLDFILNNIFQIAAPVPVGCMRLNNVLPKLFIGHLSLKNI